MFRSTTTRRAAQRAAFRVPTDSCPQLFPEGFQDNYRELRSFWTRLARMRKPEYRLLQEHLSDEQMAEARRTGWIPVVGSRGGRWLIEVYPQQLRMFKLYERSPLYGDKPVSSATHKCLVFPGDQEMPPLDWAISKVLLLEANESTVENTAL